MRRPLIACFVAAALLSCIHSQVLNSWASTLSTVTMHPTFIVTVSAGSPILGQVTVPARQSYTVYFYRPNEYFPNNPAFQFSYHTGSANFSSRPVDTTGLWRIEILPNDSSSNFLILVSVGSGQGQQKYVDVARKEKLLVGYFQSGESCNFTVQGIPYGQEREYSVEMHYGGQDLDFSRVSRVFSNAGMANNEYEVYCTAPVSGYYYIFLSVSEAIMPLFPRILVNYQSDNYPCPFPSAYKDDTQLFPNCVQLNLNSAYPCLRFDNAANTCTMCQSNYVLEDGSCYFKADCGLDSYFHQGNCFPAPANCQNYRQIGGTCTQCSPGYALTLSQEGWVCNLAPGAPATTQSTQSPSNTAVNNITTNSSNLPSNQPTMNNDYMYPATPTTPQAKPITCDEGTYHYQGLCVLFPPHCVQFDSAKLICTKCAYSYTINPSNLNCVPSTVNCLPFFTNIGNNCLPFPKNCNSTDIFGNCTSCVINYSLDSSGSCSLKQCPKRQYLSNNNCLPVDANCNEYDIYTGRCLSCLNYYILRSDGSCNPPQYSQIATNGCRSRQYRADNVCNNVDPNCDRFDEYTGYCLSCIDQTKLLDKSTGKCYSISQVCADKYYLDPITRTCMTVSPFCDTYDPATGHCLTCLYGLTLFRGGCVVLTPCSSNQYRNQDGLCTDADTNCDGVDQGTGGCIGCKPGYEINPGGVCCYAQNYLLTATCKAFLATNCLSQRPNFLNCQKCAPGYSLLNGVFGKCDKR